MFDEKPQIGDIFMAKQPISEIGSFVVKIHFHVCGDFHVMEPISELGYFATKMLMKN